MSGVWNGPLDSSGALAAAERALPPLPRDISRALALALSKRKLLPLVPPRSSRQQAGAGASDAAAAAAAAPDEAATLPGASDYATASFAQLYLQPHEFTAAETSVCG